MKRGKKLVSILLTLVMVLAMGMTAFAEGETGSITIQDSANVSVAGKTFNAYKILDVKMVGDGYVYTVPSALKEFYVGRYSDITGKEGNFDYLVAQEIQNEKDLYAFAAAALAAANDANITPVSGTASEGAKSVTINNLPLGYYVVEDGGAATPISALILDTTNPNVKIQIKADKPSIDKKIDGAKDTDDSTTGDVEYNNAAIGDKVPYKVTSKVPDMTGYTKYYFVVNDTLSKGLTFNNDVQITIGNKKLIEDTDFTVKDTSVQQKDENGDPVVDADGKPVYTGETAVEIIFKNFIRYKENTGEYITITYSATVNENAVIGTAGNPNEVTLTYSNNPNVKDNGDSENTDKPTTDSPTGTTPKETTRTYVTDLELIKVDPEGNRLTGAEFEITGKKLNKVLVSKEEFTESGDGTYWKLKDGTYTTEEPITEEDESNNTALYEDVNKKYKKETKNEVVTVSESVTAKGTVGADGVLRFEGLSAGEYTITEIKAPSGYNLLKNPITVKIYWTVPTGDSTECTWTYEGTDLVNGTNVNRITVTNQAGKELPSTGGRGTTLFYVIGGILVAAAGIVLIARRRMRAEQ